MDKNGFMNAVQGMDCSLGLDLILHTPGGSVTAAESLVYYLRKKFGTDIRVIIPQMAMSAGTMIACCSKEIVMGHQSCVGPFDPSVRNVSAFAVFDEFQRASKDIQTNPHNIPLWQTMLSKYPPAFLEECERAIELANTIVPQWLRENMLSHLGAEELETTTNRIVSALNNPHKTKEHSRHIHIEEAIELGLTVTQLENDQALQEKVLTLHHAYLATLMMTNTSKLIESHHGKKFILSYQV
ncbi:SDH family Clp fold serine proteinase [Vibrio vulnificus]|uniref:SDH family Clp fold serine proteinase n=2 Tax=Vibrionaceae TaxID=641 RepID=UPI003D9CB1C6